MSSNQNILSMVETAREIFTTANTIVEGMQPGDRKQIKDLAVAVSSVLNVEPKKVLGFVNHFAHTTDIAYVTRGKNGGLVKGVRVVKAVKPKKVKKVDSVLVTDTNE
jgi:hypothetical protein